MPLEIACTVLNGTSYESCPMKDEENGRGMLHPSLCPNGLRETLVRQLDYWQGIVPADSRIRNGVTAIRSTWVFIPRS